MTPAPDATSPASQVGEAVSVSYDAETGEFTETPPGAPIPAVQSGAVARLRERIEAWRDSDYMGEELDVDDALLLAEQIEACLPQSEPLPGGVGEAITTAAVRAGELIVTIERPGRHGDCINFLNRYGLDYMDQGFLTTHGRFVDRVEAGKIAVAAGQGAPRPQCNGNIFSEDMWPEPRLSGKEQG